jgi:hypothetical protein
MAAFHNQNPAAAEKIMHDHLLAQRQALAVYDAENGRAEKTALGKAKKP